MADSTAEYDIMTEKLRKWYEENRETWWERRSSDHPRHGGAVADELMLGLINEVKYLHTMMKIKF